MNSVLVVLLSAFLLPIASFSWSLTTSSWKAIKIPDAKCGRGGDYTVYYKENPSDKLLIEFMSGGACWNKRSCVTIPFTWVHPIIKLPWFSTLTNSDSDFNPFKEYSNLYFPYCTGDVFTGNHVSNYEGTTIYHYGYRNVELALKYLNDTGIITFKDIKDVIVWGASAGGIGAMTHGKNIEKYLSPNTKKVIIGDSIGLHFGQHFWDRFDADAKKDFKTAFNKIQLDVDFEDGFVARRMGPVLDYYKDWTLGFLYSMRDRAMSLYFGKISQDDYQALILGSLGLKSVSKNYANTHFWLSDSDEHIFLLSKKTSIMKSVDGISAFDFIKSLPQ